MNRLYLLDTHVLIWFQENNRSIPATIMAILQNPENIIFYSQISLLEVAIKKAIGKLVDFEATVEEINAQAQLDGFSFINITNQHIYQYNSVKLLDNHRDPFDRLLIATSIEENAVLITADEKFRLYKDVIDVIWND